MKILIAASEIHPLVKTGGLADVAGALPKALDALGHEIVMVMPFYGIIDREDYDLEKVLPEVIVDLPVGRRSLAVWRTELPAWECKTAPIPIYLIEDQGLFNRPELYAESGRDYPDNALRFGYFSMAAIWMLKGLGWLPDIIHCNDWQTALIPIYLARHDLMRADVDLNRIKVLFSIHNLSYQGIFPKHTLFQLGLPMSLFTPAELEYYGNINLLKGAILTSHEVATVSREYAREIQTPEFGCGLEGVLAEHKDRLTGILNGIDTEEWDPETDPMLVANFSRRKPEGKAACKKFLQKRFGLPVEPRRPLVAMVSRLTQQKGFDLLAQMLPEFLKREQAQFVVLGTGQPEYHEFLRTLHEKMPGRVGVELGFNHELAHQIEAGADLFLMPSAFEPCGLNQMISQRYGTIPVARRTGGLADSVVNATATTIQSGKATGFVFGPSTPAALRQALSRALTLYRKDPKAWAKLMDNAMARDFSWEQSAREYEKIMKKMIRVKV